MPTVAAENEHHSLRLRQGVGYPAGGRADHIGDLVHVLGAWIGSIGTPRDDLRVPEIGHLEASPSQMIDEPGGPHRRRGLLLADATRSSAGGHTNDRQLPGGLPRKPAHLELLWASNIGLQAT
jgi:hypothetical protein